MYVPYTNLQFIKISTKYHELRFRNVENYWYFRIFPEYIYPFFQTPAIIYRIKIYFFKFYNTCFSFIMQHLKNKYHKFFLIIIIMRNFKNRCFIGIYLIPVSNYGYHLAWNTPWFCPPSIEDHLLLLNASISLYI